MPLVLNKFYSIFTLFTVIFFTVNTVQAKDAEASVDLKTEIKNKNQLDKRNKDFEKNIRGKSKATFNIPSHSWAYMDKEFFETISDENYDDRAAYLENHLESKVNPLFWQGQNNSYALKMSMRRREIQCLSVDALDNRCSRPTLALNGFCQLHGGGK